MPFSYDGTLKEHHYVRENAGYFDVSHMGRLKLDYSQITEINELICSELNNIDNTKALYSMLLLLHLFLLLLKGMHETKIKRVIWKSRSKWPSSVVPTWVNQAF